VGDVATDWNIVDDTTYDFTIRDDVTFHNGNDVTAEDVRYSIELLGETDESSQTGLVEDVESVEVHNDTELTINLTSPIAPFPAFLTLRGMVSTLVSKEAHEEMGLEEYNNQPVGTGAFEIVDRTAGESISLEAHDGYFRTDEDGNQLPYFDELVVNFIPEPSTAWAAVQSGEVQFIDDLTTQLVDQAEQTDGISVVGTSPGQYYAVSHLCNNPQDYPDMAVAAGYHNTPDEFPDWSDRDLPTSDPRVREAISKAINRQEIVDRALLGYGTPAHSLWTPTTPMMYEEEPDPGQYQDQEAAEELLDEAGYTGDPRMEIDFVVHRNTERMGTVLQEQLSQVGIDVNLNIQDESNYWPAMYSYTHEISLTNSIYDFDPWHSIYRQLGIPDGSLKGAWQKGLYIDEEFDELLQESYTTPQTEERKEILEDAIEIFHEDDPYSMVAFPEIIRAMSSDLSGVEMQLGFTKFHKASLQ
jgi:peptide/nickel transport system substrate-binding protein